MKSSLHNIMRGLFATAFLLPMAAHARSATSDVSDAHTSHQPDNIMDAMPGMDMSGMNGMNMDAHKKHRQHPPKSRPQGEPSANPKTDTNMQNMPGMQTTESAHPAPPVGSLPRRDGSAPYSYAHYGMMVMKGMDDNPLISKVMLDQLEYVHGKDGWSTAWDGHARIGYNLNQLWIRSEGQYAHGKTRDADAELLWGHAIAPYWNTMAGVRHDFGGGPSRGWAAFGIQGMAPYLFYVEATAYIGSSGRTAARLKSDYDLLITQRLILTPEVEANLYGRSDPARNLGSGLSDASVGVRLRYEIRREFAPYIGIERTRMFGATADYARDAGERTHDLRLVAGVRVWY